MDASPNARPLSPTADAGRCRRRWRQSQPQELVHRWRDAWDRARIARRLDGIAHGLLQRWPSARRADDAEREQLCRPRRARSRVRAPPRETARPRVRARERRPLAHVWRRAAHQALVETLVRNARVHALEVG